MFNFEILKEKSSSQIGFTLIELLVVMSLFSILFGLATFSMFRFQGTSSQQSQTDTLISDIKAQQLKAMVGGTEGRNDSDNYGIYFLTDAYVLFHGNIYDSNDPDNFQIDLPSDLEFQNTTLLNNSIVFTKRSGELAGYVPGQDSFTIRALNIGRDIVVSINRYGVITTVSK